MCYIPCGGRRVGKEGPYAWEDFRLGLQFSRENSTRSGKTFDCYLLCIVNKKKIDYSLVAIIYLVPSWFKFYFKVIYNYIQGKGNRN